MLQQLAKDFGYSKTKEYRPNQLLEFISGFIIWRSESKKTIDLLTERAIAREKEYKEEYAKLVNRNVQLTMENRKLKRR